MSRKVHQLSHLAEELDRHNVVLRSATEPLDTGSPAGRMMLQMLGVFAEFEHATIVDRITAGIERRCRRRPSTAAMPACSSRPIDGRATSTTVMSSPTRNSAEEQMSRTPIRRLRLSSGALGASSCTSVPLPATVAGARASKARAPEAGA
jgi:resolvase-like protein